MPNLIGAIALKASRQGNPYSGTAGGMYPQGQGATDYTQRDAAPSPILLVRENLGVAYACGTLNSDLVASTRLRLYVKTRKGEGKSKLSKHGKTKALSFDHIERLQKSAGQYFGDAGDLEEVTSHPALSLLQRPNPTGAVNDGVGMSMYTLLKATQLFQETVGRAYWWAEKSDMKVGKQSLGKLPTSLWCMASQYMTEWPGVGQNSRIIDRYQFALGTGTPNNFAPEEIVPFRMMDMANGGYTGGMSPLRACFEQHRIGRFADAQQSARIQNGGKPDAMFIPSGDEFGQSIGLDEAARLQLILNSRFRMSASGQIMVSDIPGDLKPMSWPINDVIDAARYGLIKEQIATCYGVPMTKLNRGDANRASAESGDWAHANDAGLPRLRSNEAAMNTFFLPMYGDEAADRLFFAFDDPPGLENPDVKQKRFETAAARNAFTTNQLLKQAGAEEIGPAGDVRFVQNTWVPLLPNGLPDPAYAKATPPPGNEDADEGKDGKPKPGATAVKPHEVAPPKQPKKSKSAKALKLAVIALTELARTLGRKDVDTEPRDRDGEWTSEGGFAGAGERKPSDSKKNRTSEQSPSKKSKSQIAKQSASYVGKDVQRYAEEHNEPQFAKAVNGLSYNDNEPVDVVSGKGGVVTDGVELKTMVSNKASKLTMDRYAQIRKVNWEREKSATFHTVVIDDRNTFDSSGSGEHDESKRSYYYRRGVAGSARIESMHKCKNIGEVKKLMKADESDLPDGAKRSDGKIRQGRWRAISDDQGKGFKNSKTGEIVRPKK